MTVLNVFDLWQSLLTLVNVSQNGQIPPTVFQNWCNETSVQLFRDKFGNYELMQQTSDEVKQPFLVTTAINVVPNTGYNYGVVPYPADYEYFSSAKIIRQKDLNKCKCQDTLPDIVTNDGTCLKYVDPDYAQMVTNFMGDNLVAKTVNLIDNQRWESCLDHPTKGPTYDQPKITQFSGGFKIAPGGVQLMILDYLKTPQPCIFAYTISSDDILIYNPGASQQLQWSNIMKEEFLTRLAKKYAMYVQASDIFQMAENERKVA